MDLKNDEINGVKIQRLPTYGRPMSIKGSRWKSRITASNEDLKALKETIKASEKAKTEQDKK